MASTHMLTGALTGAFMMAAPMAQAQYYYNDVWLYRHRPVVPIPMVPVLPPPQVYVPRDEIITTDFDLENCIISAMEGQRGDARANAPPVTPKNIPDTLDPSNTAKTVYLDRVQTGGFLNGAMVVIDHQKDGTGSLSASAFYLHENNTDLDAEKPQPVGQGTLTRIDIAKEDVGPPGPKDTFSGPQAKPDTIKMMNTRASYIIDDIRVCMGSGPYVPGTNKLKPQLKGPGFY